MLRRITEFQNLDPRKLMDVYSESNYEKYDDLLGEADSRDFGLEYRCPAEDSPE